MPRSTNLDVFRPFFRDVPQEATRTGILPFLTRTVVKEHLKKMESP